MDIVRIAEIGTQIYNTSAFISADDREAIERLKDLATALFAELDTTE